MDRCSEDTRGMEYKDGQMDRSVSEDNRGTMDRKNTSSNMIQLGRWTEVCNQCV